jgi:hypothetical protein
MKGIAMKSIRLFAILVFALNGSAFAAGDHDHTALHGGVVAEAKDIDFELVAKPKSLRIYLRDHGKPVAVGNSNTKAKAKLTLLAGGAKQEIVFKPAGDRFEATGQFKLAGAKAVALVEIPGKPAVNVRFVLR